MASLALNLDESRDEPSETRTDPEAGRPVSGLTSSTQLAFSAHSTPPASPARITPTLLIPVQAADATPASDAHANATPALDAHADSIGLESGLVASPHSSNGAGHVIHLNVSNGPNEPQGLPAWGSIRSRGSQSGLTPLVTAGRGIPPTEGHHIRFGEAIVHMDAVEVDNRANPSRREVGVQATELDETLINALPSTRAVQFQHHNLAREMKEQQGRLQSAHTSRRASQRVLQRMVSRRKHSRVAPLLDDMDLDIDAPTRLKNRDNVRANLKGWRLVWYDFRTWVQMQRHKRRDPIPIWRSAIKDIEGQFGSTLTSFFVFLRWLFLLNAMLAMLISCVITIPTLITFDYQTRITERFQWCGCFTSTCLACQRQSYFDNMIAIHRFNLFDGEGAMGESWAFFGGYDAVVDNTYRMDLMYILTMIVLFIGCFVFVVNNIANAIGNLSSSGSLVKVSVRYPFATIMFTSWDHSFTSNEVKACAFPSHLIHNTTSTSSQSSNECTLGLRRLAQGVETLQNTIQQAFFETLAEKRAKEELQEMRDTPWRQKARLYGFRALAWFIWMTLVASAFVAVWFVVQESTTSGQQTVVQTYGPTAVFSFINGALPYPIKKLPVFLEHYKHPKTEMAITILRTFLLRILTIYALLYGFFTKYELDAVQLPSYNGTAYVSQAECAGTRVGQDLWKLIIVDTVVSICQRFGATLFFYIVYKHRVQLEVIQSVLGLVYRQAFYQCTPILMMGVVVAALLDQVKRICRPPDKRFVQNRNNTFFMFCLASTLFFVAIPVAWALKVYDPNCGPYAQSRYESAFDGIWEWVKDQRTSFQDFIATLTDPVLVCGVFIMLGVAFRAQHVRLERTRHKYYEIYTEIQQLRRDKRFLLEKKTN
ncbi:uncharacterized protein MONBRDRAFT_6695 [Monosiga brevicollis MX1]|uniref:TMC domain-containing protein n=1 Tax=Monosiga brevicollis TaxID=81824 RepID=A9UV08_MONBE|nr:uncharacterized protein MONBRDRAFT_6695 [Monosiga brevicollis MX1]EDQ90806.1 predicted protein [Monosiga brevicollis MX1]|eukprot:XP_001744103.1 hypothetical protein [Monosiga brevicollis MX1]